MRCVLCAVCCVQIGYTYKLHWPRSNLGGSTSTTTLWSMDRSGYPRCDHTHLPGPGTHSSEPTPQFCCSLFGSLVQMTARGYHGGHFPHAEVTLTFYNQFYFLQVTSQSSQFTFFLKISLLLCRCSGTLASSPLWVFLSAWRGCAASPAQTQTTRRLFRALKAVGRPRVPAPGGPRTRLAGRDPFYISSLCGLYQARRSRGSDRGETDARGQERLAPSGSSTCTCRRRNMRSTQRRARCS